MQYLTSVELKLLLQHIYRPRHKLLVLVSFWHCLRASEAVALTARNIQDGYVCTKRLKGSEKCNQPYVVHADPELDESVALAELSRILKPGERLFEMSRFGFYQLMQRAGKRAGIPPHKRHPHALKHTGVMAAIPDGVHFAQRRAGHVSMASTGFYSRISEERAARAFAKTALRLAESLDE